jgi:hypothetical protein
VGDALREPGLQPRGLPEEDDRGSRGVHLERRRRELLHGLRLLLHGHVRVRTRQDRRRPRSGSRREGARVADAHLLGVGHRLHATGRSRRRRARVRPGSRREGVSRMLPALSQRREPLRAVVDDRGHGRPHRAGTQVPRREGRRIRRCVESRRAGVQARDRHRAAIRGGRHDRAPREERRRQQADVRTDGPLCASREGARDGGPRRCGRRDDGGQGSRREELGQHRGLRRRHPARRVVAGVRLGLATSVRSDADRSGLRVRRQGARGDRRVPPSHRRVQDAGRPEAIRCSGMAPDRPWLRQRLALPRSVARIRRRHGLRAKGR